MKRSRTLKTAQATSSTDEKSRTVNINLTAPTSWRALSQEQLLTVFDLMAIEQDPTAVKTYMLIYFCGLHVIRHTRFGWKLWTMLDGKKRVIYLSTQEIQGFTRQFDFIDQVEDMDCIPTRREILSAVCRYQGHGIYRQPCTVALPRQPRPCGRLRGRRRRPWQAGGRRYPHPRRARWHAAVVLACEAGHGPRLSTLLQEARSGRRRAGASELHRTLQHPAARPDRGRRDQGGHRAPPRLLARPHRA